MSIYALQLNNHIYLYRIILHGALDFFQSYFIQQEIDADNFVRVKRQVHACLSIYTINSMVVRVFFLWELPTAHAEYFLSRRP